MYYVRAAAPTLRPIDRRVSNRSWRIELCSAVMCEVMNSLDGCRRALSSHRYIKHHLRIHCKAIQKLWVHWNCSYALVKGSFGSDKIRGSHPTFTFWSSNAKKQGARAQPPQIDGPTLLAQLIKPIMIAAQTPLKNSNPCAVLYLEQTCL